MTAELFANQPSTTVSSGGTDAPASGTQETWTVASSSEFPAASSGATPPTQFHVADAASGSSSEIVAVTNVSGDTWTVTRGAESTTPVTHSAGFTIYQVVSAGGLGTFAQTGLGDLGGSGDAPEVVSTHLGSPLPAAQGGSGSTTQQPGLTPLAPQVMAPVEWGFINYDTGPNVINAVYANNSTTPSLVDSYPVYDNSDDTDSLVTSSFSPAAGELIVVKAASSEQALVIGAPSGGSLTWTANVYEAPNGENPVAIYTARVPSPSPGSMTVTVPFSGSGSPHSMVVERWANAGIANLGIGVTGTDTAFGTGAPSRTITAALPGSVVSWMSNDYNGVNGSSRAYITTTGTPVEDGYQYVSSALTAYFAYQPAASEGTQDYGLTAPTGQKWQTAAVLLLPLDGGPGATLTADSDGALAIDGGSPAVGDRVVVANPYADAPPFSDGIYTVTSTGSADTEWVLTRSTDCETAAQLGQFWAVVITRGANWANGWVAVVNVQNAAGPNQFVVGAQQLGMAAACAGGVAFGEATTCAASESAALGTQSTVAAGANNSVALGDSSTVTGGHSLGLGSYSYTTGAQAIAMGVGSYAAAKSAFSAGPYSCAYTPDQIALSSGLISTQGDSQRSLITASGKTTTATPAAITPYDGAVVFLTKSGGADWKKTILIQGTAVARRTDTPGTDSAWSFSGIVRGNGSSSYSWVGGTAPSMTLIAQDSGASTWAASVAISSNGLALTVTGASGETINWVITMQFDEVVG